jgi:undecaprenyl-diphosphatase
MLRNHRRSFAWGGLLLVLGGISLALVGRHPSELAPRTTFEPIGAFDVTVLEAMLDIRVWALTQVSVALSVLGGGLVTIPLRVVALTFLLLRKRRLQAIAFAITWALAEVAVWGLKAWFHRGRPPDPLVAVDGFSFPSGHAMAASATAVALVLAFFPPGERRRRWEWLAVGFTFVMSVSRVYLAAHWLSDVVVGTLLGAGFAVFVAATATEIRDLVFKAEGKAIPSDEDEPEPEELLHLERDG